MFYVRSRRIGDQTAEPIQFSFIIHEHYQPFIAMSSQAGTKKYLLTDYFGFSSDFCLEIALTFSNAIFDNFLYGIINLLVNVSILFFDFISFS